MDFNSILSLAKSNSRSLNETPGKGCNPGNSVPNKPVKNKSAVQSDAIKSYMEKKKREEQQKAIEAERRKRDLLDLRAQAKNNRKATAMAKRTKDNNFMAYLSISEQIAKESAINNHSDYLPKKKPADLNDYSPQKSLQKPLKSESSIDTNHKSTSKMPRSVPSGQPTINYSELLNMAYTKQHLPIELPRIPKKKVVDADIQGRLMTNEEKKKFLEEQARKQGRSVSSVVVPPVGRRPKYRGEEQNIVVESLSGILPPAHKVAQNGASHKSINQPVRLPPKNTIPKAPANVQQKLIQKPPSQNRQSSLPPPKKAIPPSRGRDNHANVSKNGTAAQDNRPPPKSHPSAVKNLTKPPVLKNEKRPGVSSQQSTKTTTKVLASSTQKPVSNGVLRPKFAPAASNREQRVEKQLPPARNAKSALHPSKSFNGSSSSVQSSSAPLRQNPMGPNIKGMVPKGIPPKQPMQQQKRPINPPNRPLQPASSQRPLLPNKEAPPRRPLGPPANMLPRRPPPPNRYPTMRPPMKRRIESDEEYDEEMDDFIDDGPIGEDFDYSSQIKEIFGYDRSRYAYDPEDEIMESTFAQQMKEEAHSTRMGILEDLEDIQREQEELEKTTKRRKKIKK